MKLRIIMKWSNQAKTWAHLLLSSPISVLISGECCRSLLLSKPKYDPSGHFSSQRTGLALTRNIFKISSLALKTAPAVMCGSAPITKLKFPLVFSENYDKRNLYQSVWWVYLLFHLSLSKGEENPQLQNVFSGWWFLGWIARGQRIWSHKDKL